MGQCIGPGVEEGRVHALGGRLQAPQPHDRQGQLPAAIDQRELGEATGLEGVLHPRCRGRLSRSARGGESETPASVHHTVWLVHLEEDAIRGLQLSSLLQSVHGHVGEQVEEPVGPRLLGRPVGSHHNDGATPGRIEENLPDA